ncbi:MAG: hypothetical protein WAQ27_06340 [Candidatus Microsaccharimonas sp.]
MSGGTDNPLVGLLLEIKDEIDAAAKERAHVQAVLDRSRIAELDRAFASLRKAEDFERDSRLYYGERLQEFEGWRRRVFWLAGVGAALGALLGGLLLFWALMAFGAASPGICGALGGQHGEDQRGSVCAYWSR